MFLLVAWDDYQCYHLPLTVVDRAIRVKFYQSVWYGDVMETRLFLIFNKKVWNPQLIQLIVVKDKFIRKLCKSQAFILP